MVIKPIMTRLLTLLMLLAPLVASAQPNRFNMVNGDTIYMSNCRISRGNIYDDGGAGENYSAGFEGWAVIDLDTVSTFFLIYYDLYNSPNTYIEIFNNTTGQTFLSRRYGNGFVMDTAETGGILTVHVRCNPLDPTTSSGINIVWQSDSLSRRCKHSLSNISFNNISCSSAWMLWNSNTDSIYLDYGNGVHMVLGNSAMLRGLDTATTYTVNINTWADRDMPCCLIQEQLTTNLTTPPPCIDATDLTSGFTTCTYGDADNPYDTVGIMYNRHTVITDTTQTDLYGQLRCVPPGHSSSVRLGNGAAGARGEAITYTMMVDTLQYDLLLLHYAAVLQVPNHPPDHQPQLTFTIYDENMEPLDPVCGRAVFTASPALGWNSISGGNVLWKDWTTIGFDLTPYHGQYINISITTRDCTEGAHSGYAYLLTECSRKIITSPQCGANATSQLVAPEGFNYHWYTDNPEDTLSTTPNVNITMGNTTYHCHMTFIENEACGFTLDVFSGQRYPLADFDYQIVTTDCRQFNVVFDNTSTISDDGITPTGTGEPCETAYWNFGNGQTSTEYHPTTHYDTTGTYTVSLVSSIGGGKCKDTLTMDITMPTYLEYEEYTTECDSFYWWRTDKTYYDDTLGAIDLHPAPNGCDTAYVLFLKVNHSVSTLLDPDTSCWSTPYFWHGLTFSDTNSVLRTDRLTDTLRSAAGCDSLATIEVTRLPKIPISFAADADCTIKQYRLEGIHNAPYHHWSSNPPDPALNGHTEDDTLTLIPEGITTYRLAVALEPEFNCPSYDSIVLSPVTFPNALLRVSPEYLTLDNMEYDAYDIGDPDDTRTWTLYDLSGGNVVATYTPAPDLHVHGHTGSVVDSVMVELVVGNGYCNDTARASIPMIRTTLYAPNTFSPYLDNGNNRFQVIAYGVHNAELDIYNREGLLIFHSDDLEHPWDGTHDGTPCMQGPYVWHVRYIADDFPEKKQVAIGTVLLLR